MLLKKLFILKISKKLCLIILTVFLFFPTIAQSIEDTTIRIGVIAPWSPESEHEVSHLNGVKAKFKAMKDDVSDATGFKVELIQKNSYAPNAKAEEEKALKSAKELVEKHGVVAILGAVNSNATIVVQEYIESLKTNNAILITSSSTNTAITDKDNNWTFRNNLSDKKLTASIASHITKKDISKIAVFYHEGTWGTGAYNDFKGAFKGNIVYSQAVHAKKKDFTNELMRAIDNGAQGINIFAGDNTKTFIISAANRNPSTSNLPIFTIGLPHRLEQIGEETLKNVTAVSSFYNDKRNQSIQLADKILKESYGLAHLNFNSARAMESTEILLTAIINTKSSDAAILRDYIRKTKHQGLNYDIEFNLKSGDLLEKEPTFLNYHGSMNFNGRWVNLGDLKEYISPAIITFGIIAICALVYLLLNRHLKYPKRMSILITTLTLSIAFFIGEYYSITTIGNILSGITSFSKFFGGSSFVLTLAMELRSGFSRNTHNIDRQTPA
jgi:ABC-type branched-subunit amino acid transport system substrate-binding protein